jgi:hypothetical protein
MMKKILLIIPIALLFLASNAHAEFTPDTSSTIGGNATSVNGTITIGNGSNELLVIAYDAGNSVCASPTITIGGNTPTFDASNTVGTNRYSFIYHMVGQSGTLSATSTCTGKHGQAMRISSYFGVNQSSPVDVTSSFATSTSVTNVSSTITTNLANDLLVDDVAGRQDLTAAGTGQIVISTSTPLATGDHGGSSYKLVTATGTYAMSWTFGITSSYAQTIVAFAPTPTSSEGESPSLFLIRSPLTIRGSTLTIR